MKQTSRLLNDQRAPLTDEERSLLATPDKDLIAQTSEFSFARERLDQRLEIEDPSNLVLQLHLYFDHVITVLLVEALEKPSAINAKRLAFAQKTKLIEAMGLLSRELLKPIEKINEFRNKFAHDLNFSISAQQIIDLANCTPKHLRDVVLDDPDRASGPITLRELLEVVLLQIELIRQRHKYRRLAMRKGEVRLRAVLQKEKHEFKE